jgi:quercetin dioxygenase-like cupin family protein
LIISGKSNRVAAVDLEDGKSIRKTAKRVLIGPKQGAKNFVMRLFTVEEGGHSALHSHPWEHEVFIVHGAGTVKSTEGETDVNEGDFVYVPPLEEHQFLNSGDGPFEFICIVPASATG